MSTVQSVMPERLHVIVCMAFDPRCQAQEIDAFKNCLINCPDVLHAVELMGTFDFMFEAVVDDLTAYNERRQAIATPLAKMVERYESHFVCRRFVRDVEDDGAIWIPCANGLERLECSLIDKITAEGDYVRIHSRGNNWLIHSTMQSLVEKLDSGKFVQVHRSMLVRCEFIDRLIHENRRWTIQLKDGAQQRVSKGHLEELKIALRIGSPASRADSSKSEGFSDALDITHRKLDVLTFKA